jgi:beta-1,4-mannosyl-glycoprotein beta-1,4-N-acetylglucosaminyltransferase
MPALSLALGSLLVFLTGFLGVASVTSMPLLSLGGLTARPRIRVFDCFMYSSESLMLLIRLRTLSSLVTAFILGWSNLTFAGRHAQTLTFAPYETEIAAFSRQLFPLWFDMNSANLSVWGREKAARDHLLVGIQLQNPRPDDIVMISDLDEIPLPSAVRACIANPTTIPFRLRSRFFYYSLRYASTSEWIRNGVLPYGQSLSRSATTS